MSASVVVFDIGGVLIKWQVHRAWHDVFDNRKDIEAFLNRVDFANRNPRGDGGESFASLAAEIRDPDDARLLAEYPARFARTIEEAVPGTWEVAERLRAAGVPLHAITNWSAETWPIACVQHPRLTDLFGVTVVSGEERVIKPDPRIFQILCERAGVTAEQCLFVDDSESNVAGAHGVGMHTVHFTDAAALEAELVDRGLL